MIERCAALRSEHQSACSVSYTKRNPIRGYHTIARQRLMTLTVVPEMQSLDLCRTGEVQIRVVEPPWLVSVAWARVSFWLLLVPFSILTFLTLRFSLS